MELRVFQVDAFASRVFAGNPAVVCCLPRWLEDDVLRAIAAEHNISVTAFLVDRGDGFDIRYFTPTAELPLVGHASLAAAHVLLNLLRPGTQAATLQRRNGTLAIAREGDRLAIQLPVVPAQACAAPAGLSEALGAPFASVQATSGRYFVLYEEEAAVARLAPDRDGLMRLDRDVIVTAPGEECDFVSRAFAPREGLPEDPVCGSAHLTLVPYWSERLGKPEQRALQLSPRGGELHCTLVGDEVRIAGACVLYMEGTARI